ncbi:MULTISPECIES: hypothetical protein [Oscillibacter]|jgi:hypothetical protein|uniref:hypothetical protein n=1 Tax=Oscillibacter TaxID=459786 RepID=UPI00031774A3|nr:MULTISPECIES: hypothetical protein [Oscillibacter]
MNLPVAHMTALMPPWRHGMLTRGGDEMDEMITWGYSYQYEDWKFPNGTRAIALIRSYDNEKK